MRFLKNGTGLLVLALLALIVLSPLRAQDGGKPAEKNDKAIPAPEKPKKEKKPELEDAVRRAMRCVKKIDDQKFMRATVLASSVDDEAAFLVFCEFGTGDMGVFQGGVASENDQWLLMTKEHALALEEITHRQAHR